MKTFYLGRKFHNSNDIYTDFFRIEKNNDHFLIEKNNDSTYIKWKLNILSDIYYYTPVNERISYSEIFMDIQDKNMINRSNLFNYVYKISIE